MATVHSVDAGCVCYVCGDGRSKRVVHIPDMDYPNDWVCETHLFDLIKDGDVSVSVGGHVNACDNCRSDNDTVYCYSCARNVWDMHSDGDCDSTECNNCSDRAEYCSSCSEPDNVECDECSRTATIHRCSRHEYDACETCGDLTKTYSYCEEHKPLPVPAANISSDGSTIEVDGFTIQF